MVGRLVFEDEFLVVFDIILSFLIVVGFVGVFVGFGSGLVVESVFVGIDIIGSIFDVVLFEFEEELEKFDIGSICGVLGSFVGKIEEYFECLFMLVMGI